MPGLLIERVRAFCLEHQLLQPGLLIVAVSGGADSLALLHILLALQQEFHVRLHVATFDHQIRGTASAEDVRFVCGIAAGWGVPTTAGAADVPTLAKAWNMGIEAAARRARRAFLAEVADQIGAQQIALGHNQNDQAETVLMHVLRGAGLAGLRGMLPRTPIAALGIARAVDVVRPLLDTPRADIDRYVRDLNVEPRIDPTNADRTYTRNRLRHEIMPMLERLNPQVRRALARTADLARDEYDSLVRTLPALIFESPGFRIGRDAFLQLSVGQRRLLIRTSAQSLLPGLELSFERCAAAVELVVEHAHGARIALAEHVWLRVTNGLVIMYRELDYPAGCPWMAAGTALTLEGPGVYPLAESTWHLRVERVQGPAAWPADPLSALLAVPEGARLALRTRQAGDRFKPHGLHGHSQKLSDTFINEKVEAHWRDRVPLLTIGGEVAWLVFPFPNAPRSRVADSFAVQPDNLRPLWRFTFDLA